MPYLSVDLSIKIDILSYLLIYPLINYLDKSAIFVDLSIKIAINLYGYTGWCPQVMLVGL